LVLAATAAAIVAVVSIPSLDSGDAVAADLRGLSQAAVSYDGPVLGEGSWLHERSESLQRNDPNSKEVAVLDTHRETWTRWDGRVLVIEQRPSEGWTTYNVLDDSTAASYQDPTPVFAQTLPDNAEGLRAYLDPKVFGSSSHSEALFEALTSLATSHTLPPPTLAAAYEALADVDHVRTSHVTADGRPAIEVAYEEGLTSSTDSITVDRATGQVLTTSLHSLQSTYTTNAERGRRHSAGRRAHSLRRTRGGCPLRRRHRTTSRLTRPHAAWLSGKKPELPKMLGCRSRPWDSSSNGSQSSRRRCVTALAALLDSPGVQGVAASPLRKVLLDVPQLRQEWVDARAPSPDRKVVGRPPAVQQEVHQQ
jgi:hypothetical protein